MNRRPTQGDSVPLAELEARITLAVRESLIGSYPSVDIDEIVRLVDTFGMDSLPNSLFLEGDKADDGETGMRSRLRAAADSELARRTPLHPLFSAAFYDLMYPSVREQGLSPWTHFHVFGVSEGLSPSFFLDVDYLGHASKHIHKAARIDDYLLNRSSWFRAPSPYVDIEKFIISGNWDRLRHPLVSVLASNREWIQDRLMLIDSNWGDSADAQANAAGYLLNSMSGGAGDRVLLFEAPVVEHELSSARADWRVIPGIFVGSAGIEPYRLSSAMLSPDRSMVRLQASVVVRPRGDSIPASRLIVVDSTLSRSAIDELLASADVADAIAPFDSNQAAVLLARTRLIRGAPAILAWGQQVLVQSATLVRFESRAVEPAEWSWDDQHPSRGLVFYLDRVAPNEQRLLAQWLESGAHLCLEGSGGVGPWIPELERSEIVVVPRELIGAVRSVVADDRIRILRGRSS